MRFLKSAGQLPGIVREFEVRVPSIDPGEMRAVFRRVKAVPKGNVLLRRIVYHPPAKEGHLKKWVRLRTDGSETELTMKSIKSWKVGDVFEATTWVESFDATAKILASLGCKSNYQEDVRETWELPEAVLTIDYWPRISPLLEVEGRSKKAVLSALKKLGIEKSKATTLGIDEIYALNGIDLHSFPEMRLSKRELALAGISGE